jgi:hypothetical protein
MYLLSIYTNYDTDESLLLYADRIDNRSFNVNNV